MCCCLGVSHLYVCATHHKYSNKWLSKLEEILFARAHTHSHARTHARTFYLFFKCELSLNDFIFLLSTHVDTYSQVCVCVASVFRYLLFVRNNVRFRSSKVGAFCRNTIHSGRKKALVIIRNSFDDKWSQINEIME